MKHLPSEHRFYLYHNRYNLIYWHKIILILPMVGLSFCTFIAIRPKITFNLFGQVHGTTFANSFSNSFKHSAMELGERCSWSWFPSLVGCRRNEALEIGFDVESIQIVNFSILIPDQFSDCDQFIFIFCIKINKWDYGKKI